MIIILMGYMGSGKSTVGRKLAQVLGYNHIDLDDYIENKEQNPIPVIFKNKGEIYFRKKERFYLNEVLNGTSDIVLSLGGGTPCYGDNLKLILKVEKALSFYLKLSVKGLVKRLAKEKESRPVISHLNNEDMLTEFIGKHLFERNFYYTQSDYTIDTDNLDIEETVETIVLKLV